METAEEVIEYLKGKKAYFIAVAACVTAVGSFVAGEINLHELLVGAIFASGAVAALRAGVSNG